MVTLSSPCATDTLSTASSPSFLTMFPVARQPVLIQPERHREQSGGLANTARSTEIRGSKLVPLAQPHSLSPRSHTAASSTNVHDPWQSLRTDAVLALKSEAAPVSKQATFAARHDARRQEVPPPPRHKAVLAPSASAPHPPRRARVPLMRPPYLFLTSGLNQSLRCTVPFLPVHTVETSYSLPESKYTSLVLVRLRSVREYAARCPM